MRTSEMPDALQIVIAAYTSRFLFRIWSQKLVRAVAMVTPVNDSPQRLCAFLIIRYESGK